MRKKIDPSLFEQAQFMPPLKNTAYASGGVWNWVLKNFNLSKAESRTLRNRWRVRADRGDERSPWVRTTDPKGQHFYTGRLYGRATVPEIEHLRFQFIELVMNASSSTLKKMLSSFSEGEHEKT